NVTLDPHTANPDCLDIFEDQKR
ncbi:hypothetical protein E2320_014552, partial [Naja naja]